MVESPKNGLLFSYTGQNALSLLSPHFFRYVILGPMVRLVTHLHEKDATAGSSVFYCKAAQIPFPNI
jgi:hypothetical protein